jgi:hypothetical protein
VIEAFECYFPLTKVYEYLNRTYTCQPKKYTSFTKRLLDGLILLLFGFSGEWYVKKPVEEWP